MFNVSIHHHWRIFMAENKEKYNLASLMNLKTPLQPHFLLANAKFVKCLLVINQNSYFI